MHGLRKSPLLIGNAWPGNKRQSSERISREKAACGKVPQGSGTWASKQSEDVN